MYSIPMELEMPTATDVPVVVYTRRRCNTNNNLVLVTVSMDGRTRQEIVPYGRAFPPGEILSERVLETRERTPEEATKEAARFRRIAQERAQESNDLQGLL